MNKLIPLAALAASLFLSGCLQHLPTASITSTPHSPQSVVSNSGQIVGQDPDPNIRADLSRNACNYLGQCSD